MNGNQYSNLKEKFQDILPQLGTTGAGTFVYKKEPQPRRCTIEIYVGKCDFPNLGSETHGTQLSNDQ